MGDNTIKKKKGLFLGIIIIILIAGLLLYFKPLSLSSLVNKKQYIVISYQEFSIKNGSPYIDGTTYNEITKDQKSRITDLLKQYSYKRTLGTIFSDGSMTNMGEEFVNIFTYDGSNNLINTISIASSDNISVNGKNYIIKKSSQLINELMEIINK